MVKVFFLTSGCFNPVTDVYESVGEAILKVLKVQ
jgi:hypothetical protein